MKTLPKQQYLEDINILKENLLQYHPEPYKFLTKEELEEEIKSLEDNVSVKDFGVSVMKLLSKLKDGHTELCSSAEVFGIRNYPIKIGYLTDGCYLLKTAKRYKGYLGKKVIKIHGKDMGEIENIFSQVIPLENIVSLKYYLPSKLKEPVLCKKLGLNDGGNLVVEFEDGKVVDIEPSDYNTELISAQKTSVDDRLYWSKVFENIFYFQYNKCEEDSDYPISRVIKEIEESKLGKVIIDLRFNKGGNSEVLQPLIEYLKKKNIRVIVFTGEDTYSSAIINTIRLSKIKGSISIGDIPHGSPTHYGEYMKVRLPNTGLEVKISTKYFKYDGYELGDVFKPMYEVKQSIGEYMNGKDVCMELVENM